MLVAEAMIHPGVRQIDLARSMGVDSTTLGNLTHFLGKARILDRQTVGGRVILGPGKRCAEVGLNADAAQALTAARDSDPHGWHATVHRLFATALTSYSPRQGRTTLTGSPRLT